MVVFHFSFSVGGAVPPEAAATALADGADAAVPPKAAATALADGADAAVPPFNLEVSLTLSRSSDAACPSSDAAIPLAATRFPTAPWNNDGADVADVCHPDGADVANAKMFAKISGLHAKVSEEATEECRIERTLCENERRQAAAEAAEAARWARQAKGAAQFAAEAARWARQKEAAEAAEAAHWARTAKAAPPPRVVKVRPRAKKAAALQKAHPPRDPKQVAAMMKAAAVHCESSSSSD
jgi:hypothetical protein